MTAAPNPPTPHWSTSSFGEQAHPSPVEVSALHDHLRLCNGLHGRLFRVQCGADAVHRFVAGRIVTTLVGLALLAALIGWLS